MDGQINNRSLSMFVLYDSVNHCKDSFLVTASPNISRCFSFL